MQQVPDAVTPAQKPFDRAPGAGRKQVKLSIQLSENSRIIRQPKGPTTAHHFDTVKIQVLGKNFFSVFKTCVFQPWKRIYASAIHGHVSFRAYVKIATSTYTQNYTHTRHFNGIPLLPELPK